MKPLPIDLLPGACRPLKRQWMALIAVWGLGLLAAVAAGRQDRQVEERKSRVHRQAERAAKQLSQELAQRAQTEDRTKTLSLSLAPQASHWLGLRQFPWDGVLLAVERAVPQGAQLRHLRVDAESGSAYMTIAARSPMILQGVVSDLNAGEETESWSLRRMDNRAGREVTGFPFEAELVFMQASRSKSGS